MILVLFYIHTNLALRLGLWVDAIAYESSLSFSLFSYRFSNLVITLNLELCELVIYLGLVCLYSFLLLKITRAHITRQQTTWTAGPVQVCST